MRHEQNLEHMRHEQNRGGHLENHIRAEGREKQQPSGRRWHVAFDEQKEDHRVTW